MFAYLSDELLFSLDALKLLQKLTDGKILQAVCRDTNWDVPYVELFTKGEKASTVLQVHPFYKKPIC